MNTKKIDRRHSGYRTFETKGYKYTPVEDKPSRKQSFYLQEQGNFLPSLDSQIFLQDITFMAFGY